MIVCCIAMIVAACGSGMSGNQGGPGAQNGTALMTLTDASGDFLSYAVTVDSIRLVTAGGATVETLPTQTTVDFAQLVELSEVISAGQIPPADYVGAQVTLDYGSADITADGGDGTPVALNPVDAGGHAISGTVTETVTLDRGHPLIITPGSVGLLAFDFNLAASNTVDLTAGTVTVSPTLTATVVPSGSRPIHVRGLLAGTSSDNSGFVLTVEPFHSNSPTAGTVTVDVTPTTTYLIDGRAYVGSAGLAALAGLSADRMVAAYGTLVMTPPTSPGTSGGTSSSSSPASSGSPVAPLPGITGTLTARSVVAGTSLINQLQSEVAGTVIARSGNILTVHAATWYPPGGRGFQFMLGNVQVTVGPDTVVFAQGQAGPLSHTDISVGQHIDVFGTDTTVGGGAGSASSSPSSSASSSSSSHSPPSFNPDHIWQGGAMPEKTLDATAGEVQLDATSLLGVVGSAGAGTVTVTLKSQDGFPPSLFNFAGTGAPGGTDAAPAAYVVSVPAGLGLAAAGAPVGFTGLVTPFGAAPPDFSASSVISIPAYLNLTYSRGSATAITAGSSSLSVSVSGAGPFSAIVEGPQLISLSTLTSPLTVVPDAGSGTLFSIGHWGQLRTDNFNSFPDFVGALTADLGGSAVVLGISASGSCDSSTGTFTATHLVVLLGGSFGPGAGSSSSSSSQASSSSSSSPG